MLPYQTILIHIVALQNFDYLFWLLHFLLEAFPNELPQFFDYIEIEKQITVDPLTKIIHFFICKKSDICMGHFMYNWPISPIYYIWTVYLYSTSWWNGPLIIIPFAFVFIILIAFICLFLNVHILPLVIYPPAPLWFDLFSICVLIMTWFFIEVIFYFTNFCKWCIIDDWNQIICFLCGFLFGVLSFISIIVTVTYLNSVVIIIIIIYDICSIC